jgi:hypothetical protein
MLHKGLIRDSNVSKKVRPDKGSGTNESLEGVRSLRVKNYRSYKRTKNAIRGEAEHSLSNQVSGLLPAHIFVK